MIGTTLGHFRITEKLGHSIDEHSINTVYTPVAPAYYAPGLENDPRYLELMDRLGFPARVLEGGAR